MFLILEKKAFLTKEKNKTILLQLEKKCFSRIGDKTKITLSQLHTTPVLIREKAKIRFPRLEKKQKPF